MTENLVASGTTIARIGRCSTAEIEGDLVLMNLDTGQYAGISGAGTRIWALLEQPVRMDALVQRLTAMFQVDEARCIREVSAFCRRLEAIGLLQLEGDPR